MQSCSEDARRGMLRVIGSEQAGVKYTHWLYSCVMYADVFVHQSA